MSLLLDALKKAQQEKAEKDAVKASSAEQAENSNQINPQPDADEQARSPTQSQLSKTQQQDQENLSIDDVTDFMGDDSGQYGLADIDDEQISRELAEDSPATNDNDRKQDSSIDQYKASDTVIQEPEQQSAYALTEESLELEPLDDTASLDEPDDEDNTYASGAETRINTLDIDQFTSDLTIRRKDLYPAKKTKTDNYEKTLLKVSEPSGLYDRTDGKSGDEVEMSPEYARKMFVKKNVSSRLFYIKSYAAISLFLLLIIALWGLIQVEERFAMIEQGLVGLKKDPMPEIIQPNLDRSAARLLDSETQQAKTKAMDILARAESDIQIDVDSQAGSDEDVSTELLQRPARAIKNQLSETSSVTGKASASDGIQAGDQLSGLNAGQTEAADQAVQTSAKPSTSSSIQLSSSLKISQLDRLLQQAYQAYERDDIDQARQAYDQVLGLDAENRDGLLGRAAIHVIEEQYQAAIDQYQLILERNPNDIMALTSLISVAKIDPEAGESQLKSLLRQQPDTAYLHFALGNMYGHQQRWSEAQNAYFNALHLARTDPDYAYNLAVSLEHLGKPEAAITYYRRALVNSRDARANFDRERVRQRIEVLGQ